MFGLVSLDTIEIKYPSKAPKSSAFTHKHSDTAKEAAISPSSHVNSEWGYKNPYDFYQEALN